MEAKAPTVIRVPRKGAAPTFGAKNSCARVRTVPSVPPSHAHQGTRAACSWVGALRRPGTRPVTNKAIPLTMTATKPAEKGWDDAFANVAFGLGWMAFVTPAIKV